MPTKTDRAWWHRAWAARHDEETLADFRRDLGDTLSPWVAYADGPYNTRTLVGGLMRPDHWVLPVLLKHWLDRVENINSPPPGHPALLHCLPANASLQAVEILLAAGSDPLALDKMGHTPAQSWVASLLSNTKASYAALEQGWKVAGVLLEGAGQSLSDIPPPPGNASWLDWALCKSSSSLMCPEAWRVVFRGTGWDMDWRTQTPRADRLRSFFSAGWLDKDVFGAFVAAGLPLAGSAPNGDTFGHMVLMSPRMSYTGNPEAPIHALLAAAEAGMDFQHENQQGYTVEQRLAAIRWENQDALAHIDAALRARALHQATPPSPSQPSRLRL